MKWTCALAGLVVALGATVCLAETPDMSSNRPQAMTLFGRGALFTGQNWWNRYGEAVNATALSQAEASPSDKFGAPAAMGAYGDGYIFGPGSCDCAPPCIADLWTGYFQDPMRCHPGGWLVASGIIDHREDAVVAGLQSAGFHNFQRQCRGEWVALMARRAPTR